jgi:hypothetical protein
MGAFIAAGLILAVTLTVSFLSLMAEAMNDTRGDGGIPRTLTIFGCGTVLSALVLASHWVHIGW